MPDNPMLEELLENIRIQLLEAQISFDIWLALSPGEENSVWETLGSYRGFFTPTRSAHQDRFLIKVANVTDTKKNSPSVYRLLQIIEIDPCLAPNSAAGDLRTSLEKLRKVERKVRSIRNKNAAHWEIGANPEEVDVTEVRDMLADLEKAFNNVWRELHPKESWSFRPVQSSDTKNVLDSLNRYHNINAPASIVAWMAVQDKDNPEKYIIDAEVLRRLRDAIA